MKKYICSLLCLLLGAAGLASAQSPDAVPAQGTIEIQVRGMTLLEAIVGAGDITDWGSRYVQVTRGGKTVTYDYFSIKDRAIPIQPNDRIFVPQRGIFEGRPAKLLP